MLKIFSSQGKLYTQIDTDDFQVAQSNLLDQFRVLISKSPLPLSSDRLVQIMALNMFIIEESKLRSSDSGNSTYRSLIGQHKQYSALIG